MTFDLADELLHCLRKRDSLNKEPARKAVRGGNSGVMNASGKVVTSESGSCLRVALLRSEGIQGPKDLRFYLTTTLGLAYETVFKALEHSDKFKLTTQIPVSKAIEGSTVPFHGTKDFELTFHNGYRLIVDTKSVSSLDSFMALFQEQKVKISYVAQLVSYMEASGVNQAYLVPASFIYVKEARLTAGTQRDLGKVTEAGKVVHPMTRIQPQITSIPIQIVGDGVLVQGKKWDFKVSDVLRHRKANAKAQETGEVPARPVAPEGDYSPCNLCPFRKACDLFDTSYNQTLEEFTTLATYEVIE